MQHLDVGKDVQEPERFTSRLDLRHGSAANPMVALAAVSLCVTVAITPGAVRASAAAARARTITAGAVVLDQPIVFDRSTGSAPREGRRSASSAGRAA